MPEWLGRLWYGVNYAGTMALYTLAFSLRFEGARHVPATGPVLLLANHQSFLDPVAVGLAVSGRQIQFLARKTLFRPDWFGAYLRSVGVVAVDQEGVAKEGLQTTLDVLARGRPVLVFPEGERTPDGAMKPFKPGVTLLLKYCNAPVVPVGIAGAFEAYPRRAKVPTPAPLFVPSGNGVAVSIGPPLDPAHYRGKSREEVLDVLFRAVDARRRRAERLRRRP